MPRNKTPQVLIIARREDLMKYAMRLASECGFEVTGALNNDDAKAALEKQKFVACIFGNVFNNADMWEKDRKEMKVLLDERQIPYQPCPTFGDARTALKELGLFEEPKKPEYKQLPGSQDQAAIAG